MNVHDSYRRVGSVLLALAVLASGLGLAPDAALATAGVPSSFYYYADGQRIPLAVSTQWAAVRFADADPRQQASALQEAGAPLDASGERRDLLDTGLTLLPISPGTGEEALLQGLRAMRQSAQGIRGASPVFLAADSELVLTDEFIATFRPGMGRNQVERINARHGVSILSEVLDQPNTFVLQLPAGAEQDALEMSNLYKESGEALTAAPNFLMLLPPDQAASRPEASGPTTTTPNDPMYYDQWALNNTGGVFITPDNDIDAPEAWAIEGGDLSVVIAIVDEGVELTHEDLASKLVPGYDATGGMSAGGPCTAPCGWWDPNLGSYMDDPHGTLVAGIAAAATNNSLGVAGVCPNCRLMPVRIASTNYDGWWVTTAATIANGITWAYLHGASVINLSLESPPATVITTAINNARSKGRGGKGTVVVGAAGNDGHAAVSYPASLSSVIAVGALNMCAARKTAAYTQCNEAEDWWASDYGSALDLMAPGLWLDTTDRMGSYGAGTGNYIDFMNGTSGAAPIVAGVAGLVLSVNPDLTALQVQTVLTKNADDLPPAGKDPQTAFGRVNAYRAVTAAQTMRVMTNLKHGTVLDTSVYIPGLSSTAVERPGAILHPALVASSDGIQKRVVSKVSLWYSAGNPVSYTEMMGVPKAQLTTEYWFPWYDNSDATVMQQRLIITNADLVYNNTVQVYIGGLQRDSFILGPGESLAPAYVLSGGPVRIRSANAKKLIASLQAQAIQSSAIVSSSEMMGLPKLQLATEYYFPLYDNSTPGTLAETLRVSNADLNYPANVQVLMGNTIIDSFTLTKGTSREVSPGLTGGPLRVRTTNAKKIVASIGATYGGSTYSEWMGIPKPKITNTYYFPQYVNGGVFDQVLRIVNVDLLPANVEVMVNGVVEGTYTVSPGDPVTDDYDLYEGPVRVRSTNGKKILVSIQMSILSGGMPHSYHELYGLPYTLLSPEYWFPVYDDSSSSLMEFVRMGRP